MMSDVKVIPVRVGVRIRPLSEKEKSEGSRVCLNKVPNQPQLALKCGTDEKSFRYDYVYSPESSQLKVYDSAVSAHIQNLFKGYNVTVLAYGQTGSGKTFTMGTLPEDVFDSVGIIPRVVKDIFSRITEESYLYNVKVSFLELYKDKLYDLLDSSGNKDDACVDIREDARCGIVLVGQTEKIVSSSDAALKILEEGSLNRMTGSTAMNKQSSRSHAVFTLTLEQKDAKTGESNGMKAKFHLVDLAGSERQKKTRAEGNTFQEGVKINCGLLALGNVISALCDNLLHIPYRNSKLTRLLQDSLGGNSYTVMIACVSPADDNYEETLATLRYADRARKIKNKPVINQDPQQQLIAKLQAELEQYKLKLDRRRSSIVQPTASQVVADGQLDLLREENETLKTHLQEAWRQVTEAEEKKIMTEVTNEKLKEKLRELRVYSNETLSQSFTAGMMPENLQVHIESLRAKVEEIQEVHEESEKNFDNNTFAVNGQDEDGNTVDECDESQEEEVDEPHINKQAKVNERLQILNQQLREKENFLSQLRTKDMKWETLQKQYDSDIQKLQQKVEDLSKEKLAILQSKEDKANVPSDALKKLAEQRRKKVQELEKMISDSKQKIKEMSKLLKLHERDGLHLQKLQKDIQEMKYLRVKLIKQMKEEGERFRKFRQQKEKEICQLKQVTRKQEFQQKKKDRMHDKQKNVMRRKMEETLAVNKRLKDALDRQRVAQEKRNMDSKGSNQHTKLMEWLQGEVEVAVSIREAENNIEELLQDRRELNKQLNKLSSSMSPSAPTRVTELKREIAVRASQIDDLRDKVNKSQEDVKRNTRWDNIKVLGEAKVVLRSLLDTVVQAKCSVSSIERSRFNTAHDLKEAIEASEKAKEQLEDMKRQKDIELIRVRKDYENKAILMLEELQNKNTSTDSNSEEKRLVEFQIEEITRLRAQLKEETEKRERLESSNSRRPLPKLSRRPKMSCVPDSPDFDAIGESTDEDDESDRENDPDWVKTPIYQRLKKIQEQSNITQNTSVSDTCKCKSGCATKICSCKKSGRFCASPCKCKNCKNRNESSDSGDSLNGTFVSASEGSSSNGDGSFIRKRRSSEDTGAPDQRKSRKLFNITNIRVVNGFENL